MQWCLVLPVKRLAVAKTRLSGPYAGRRRDLALAFALDTAVAARSASAVVDVVAVTDEPAARDALLAVGMVVVADVPDAGLNPALAHGATQARALHPRCGVGALSADLPALKAPELDTALARGAEHDLSYVRDGEGTGTTLVLARSGTTLQPAFGPQSALRHAEAGHVDLTQWAGPGLRSDVDTADDLRRARRLGVGPRTAEVLGSLTELG